MFRVFFIIEKNSRAKPLSLYSFNNQLKAVLLLLLLLFTTPTVRETRPRRGEKRERDRERL